MDRYKVVINKVMWKGHFGSCVVNPGSDFHLTYKLHEITWAPLGSVGILVFESLDCANDFFYKKIGDWEHNMSILKGEVIDEYICDLVGACEYDFLKGCYGTQWPPPLGTLRCAGFKPEQIIFMDRNAV